MSKSSPINKGGNEPRIPDGLHSGVLMPVRKMSWKSEQRSEAGYAE